jgi:hypothetical protein
LTFGKSLPVVPVVRSIWATRESLQAEASEPNCELGFELELNTSPPEAGAARLGTVASKRNDAVSATVDFKHQKPAKCVRLRIRTFLLLTDGNDFAVFSNSPAERKRLLFRHMPVGVPIARDMPVGPTFRDCDARVFAPIINVTAGTGVTASG